MAISMHAESIRDRYNSYKNAEYIKLAVLKYNFVLLQLIFVLFNIREGVWFLELAIRCSDKRGS